MLLYSKELEAIADIKQPEGVEAVADLISGFDSDFHLGVEFGMKYATMVVYYFLNNSTGHYLFFVGNYLDVETKLMAVVNEKM